MNFSIGASGEGTLMCTGKRMPTGNKRVNECGHIFLSEYGWYRD